MTLTTGPQLISQVYAALVVAVAAASVVIVVVVVVVVIVYKFQFKVDITFEQKKCATEPPKVSFFTI